jgi:putative transposase
MPRTRRSYPSDLTDHERNLLQPLLASPERRGRPPKWPARRIADAVLSTALWLCLAHAAKGISTVADGLLPFPQVEDRRPAAPSPRPSSRGGTRKGRARARPQHGGDRQPGGEDHPVGGPERGYDGAKRLSGRKRHVLVDTGGLELAARVHGADLPDRDGGRRLLEDGEQLPRMELVWADGAYTGGFREWLRRRLGWRLEVPHHPDRQLWRYGLEKSRAGSRCFLAVGSWSALRVAGLVTAV